MGVEGGASLRLTMRSTRRYGRRVTAERHEFLAACAERAVRAIWVCGRRTKRHEWLCLDHSECGCDGIAIGVFAAALSDRACDVAGHISERLRLVNGCRFDQPCDPLARLDGNHCVQYWALAPGAG
jgi:hypothetical protein